MSKIPYMLATAMLAAITLVGPAPLDVNAQERILDGVAPLAPDTLSREVKTRIREFYAAHPSAAAKPLPPGIRRNLERGKTLPPGIAKKTVPEGLLAQLQIADGFELVEVGLDVFLVEVATNVIHDVLWDIIR